jgi:hypothetical protein
LQGVAHKSEIKVYKSHKLFNILFKKELKTFFDKSSKENNHKRQEKCPMTKKT